MGVYIKDIEMSKSCYVCPFCDYVSARCDAVKGNPYTPESRYEKRADFCPLVHVPPHGRLIDADALDTSILQAGFSYAITRRKLRYTPGDVRQKIANAPTIIPAEEGET